MKVVKSDIRKITRGFQITLPRRFCERYGIAIGDSVEIVDVGGVLTVRPVEMTRTQALAALDDILVEADAARDAQLSAASDDEALGVADREIKARRQRKTT